METPSSNVFPPISRASVKVMRSHDYCHFEVVLGTENDVMADITPAQVDNLRKEAARLADKAVEQYKIAKETVVLALAAQNNLRWDKREVARINAIAETDRTPEDKARLKAHEDAQFYASRRYDYEDDWQAARDEG